MVDLVEGKRVDSVPQFVLNAPPGLNLEDLRFARVISLARVQTNVASINVSVTEFARRLKTDTLVDAVNLNIPICVYKVFPEVRAFTCRIYQSVGFQPPCKLCYRYIYRSNICLNPSKRNHSGKPEVLQIETSGGIEHELRDTVHPFALHQIHHALHQIHHVHRAHHVHHEVYHQIHHVHHVHHEVYQVYHHVHQIHHVHHEVYHQIHHVHHVHHEVYQVYHHAHQIHDGQVFFLHLLGLDRGH